MERLVLYGSPTSPYVRRVRVVAHELSLSLDVVDTRTPEGDARLREVTPLWKIPVLQTEGGEDYLDSHSATEFLLRRFGPQPLRSFDASSTRDRNLITVIDGAIDALINVMYVGRDGVAPESSAYLLKQRQRAASAMAWLERACGDSGFGRGFGLPEVALVTTAGWMSFRGTYSIDDHPRLAKLVAELGSRDSFRRTAPSEVFTP